MISKTRYTFYVPIHDPIPFDDTSDVLSQILQYFKKHNIDKNDVIITQTSTHKLNMSMMSWIMSKEYDKELRNLTR